MAPSLRLLAAALAAAALAGSAPGQVLHAVTGCERDANLGLGNCVVLDEENVVRFLQSQVPAAQLRLHRLTQAQMTPAGIVRAIRALKVAPQDAVFFYSSTHGAWDDRVGQFLDLGPRGSLPRSVIREALVALKPRLAVLVTDCCSSLKKADLRSLEEAGLVSRIKAASSASQLGHVAKVLFFEGSGVVDITSCARGEASVGYDDVGSLFTQVMLELFRVKGDTIADWPSLFARLNRLTIDNFKKIEKGGINSAGQDAPANQFAQTPTAFYLPGKGRVATDHGAALPANVATTPPAKEPSTSAGQPPVFGVTVSLNGGGGVVVTAVREGTLAKRLGLAPGDVILSVGTRSIKSLTDFSDAIDQAEAAAELEVRRKADGQVYRMKFRPKS